MRYLFITALIITASATIAAADRAAMPIDTASATASAADSTAVSIDTAAIKAAHDSMRTARAAIYGNAAARFDPASHSQSDVFCGDGASEPEILRYRALTSVAVPFSLSSSLNRLLHYGDPAYTQRGGHSASMTAQPPFLPYSPRFFGGGLLSGAQAESFTVSPQSGLSYAPYPITLTFPELSIFWENGVFDQNTLNIRLSRPLSPRLALSAHARYRFINGQLFNHERNDVANVYKTFYADTSLIMNRGYNPRVDERAMGAALLRANADSSKLYAAFLYANLQNEYALDLLADAPDRLRWAALGRTVYRFDASITDKELRPLRVNAKAALINEELRSSYKADTSSIANGGGDALSFIVDADAALSGGAGIAVNTMVKSMKLSNDAEHTFSEHRAEAFYKREFKHAGAASAVNISAGAAIFLGFDTLYTPNYQNGRIASAKAEAAASRVAPTGRATAALSPDRGKARLSLFAEISPYAVYPDYNPPRLADSRFNVPYGGVWANSNVAVGAEAQAQTRFAGILLGYRRQTNDDIYLLRSLWPEGYPPYKQPGNTVIIAPWTERAKGVALISKVVVTDGKPFVKASARLSHTTHPAGMDHTFETEVGFDYWSANEPFAFGAYSTGSGYYYGWNEPIFDLNVKIAAHIKTFRLFYKMDNLLNRKLSYVPGYFSPGLTFRWGFNWFLL